MEWDDRSDSPNSLTAVKETNKEEYVQDAKERGLLFTPGWKRLARRSKILVRLLRQQSKLKSFKISLKFKYAAFEIPNDYADTIQLSANHSNHTRWSNSVEIVEIHQLMVLKS